MARPDDLPPSHLVRDLAVAIVGAVAVAVALYLGSGYLPTSAPPLELQLIEAGGIVLVGYLVAHAFSSAVRRILRAGRLARQASAATLFVNTLVGVGILLGILLVFRVAPESVFLGSAFAAVVLGLASQTVLANLFSGFLLIVAQPFHPGERVSVVTPSYGTIWPSYPRELTYPAYTGVVRDISLFYTSLELDSGRSARIPNSQVVNSLVIALDERTSRAQRVRMTLPYTVSVDDVAAVARALATDAVRAAGTPEPEVQVADVSPTTWDAVIVLWTRVVDEDRLRDAVLRGVLARLRTPAGTLGGSRASAPQ